MLTAKQTEVYEFIKGFMEKHGYAPTMAEIAKGIGISSRGVVHRYVSAIADEGLLGTVPNKRRNIVLTEEAANSSIPLVGKIAAGQPIMAIEQQESIDVGSMLLGARRFALRVNGDSMVDEGILDEDIVVCEQSEVANNGQIVVALIDDEMATLKRMQRNVDGTVTLIPANNRYDPVVYEGGRVKVQGIYIGLLRMAH